MKGCKPRIVLLMFLSLAVPLSLSALGQSDRPARGSGQAWSERMGESLLRHRYGGYGERWDYVNGTVLSGLQALYTASGKIEYLDYIRATVERHTPSFSPRTRTLDNVKEGTAVLFLYDQTPEGTERARLATFAHTLRGLIGPGEGSIRRTSEGGLWHKDPGYAWQMWADGLYMAQPFLAQYARLFHTPKSAEAEAIWEDVALQFLLFERHARDPETGLLYHGWSERPADELSALWADPATGRSASFWARAIGWYAMGLVDALDHFPAEHPLRPRLVEILARLVPAIVRYQDAATGCWYDVVDQGPRKGIARENYIEASASCMFAYVILKSARLGYVDSGLRAAGEKAYRGILKHLLRVQTTSRGERLVFINECAVSGLGGNSKRDGSFEYYMREPVVTSEEDGKPIGPFILASLEMEGRW